MMSDPIPRDEFLLWEANQRRRYEWVDGFVQPRFGDHTQEADCDSEALGLLVGALVSAIVVNADPYKIDITFKVETASSVRYPDIVATCEQQDQPILIVEVLTDLSAREDLGLKMREYQSIDTLREYLVIDSRKRWARLTSRACSGWKCSPIVRRGVVDLEESIGLSLNVDWIYDRVEAAPVLPGIDDPLFPVEFAGAFRRIGEIGPIYQVLGPDSVRNGRSYARILLIETEEETTYPIKDMLIDPRC